MTHNITAVVLYCSIEKRFINKCVTNLLDAGLNVNIVYYDHLYSGEPEDFDIYMGLNSRVNYLKLKWSKDMTPLGCEAWARYTGQLQSDCDYTLFIDADEIVEPIAFRNWLDTGAYKKYKSLKLAQHLYSIHPTYQLKKIAYNTILCKTSWAKSLPFQQEARFNAYWNNKNKLSRWTAKLGINPDFGYYRGKPFIHHYTNVRSIREMYKKVNNYSHSLDPVDHESNVKSMFNTAGKNNKIGGDEYRRVPNYFNIDETNLYKIP